MIIISDLRGQLCNRIFLTAYGLSLSELTGQRFFDFSLDKYADLFPATRRSKWIEPFYKLTRYTVRAIVKMLWMAPGHPFVIDVTWENTGEHSPGNPEFISRLKRRPLSFLRVDQYLDISKITFPPTQTIRETFTPDPEIMQMVQAHARAAKDGADVLIGLHIRRGDFDIHLGGRYYYPIAFYRETVDRIASFFPNQRIAFLLCSNEKLPLEIFAPYQVTTGPGTSLGDLYCMAECDYLLGPPSTYSLWAAYYKRKPIHHMFRREAPASLDQFWVPDGHFECYELNIL